MTVYQSVAELIGDTPLVELVNYEANNNLEATIVGKVESFNPAGSIKDRIAKAMIDDALERGVIDGDTVLIEPTSGNTGIGLAAIAAARGMRLIIAMPETMSIERRNLMKAYGAELVLTDGALGMKGAIARADELAAEIPNSFIVGQFTNPANPAIHEVTTGPEIWEATDGQVDIFVAGVGTGGTVSGTGAYLKRMNPDVQVVAVEPASSPVLSEGRAGAHKIQGIGAGFVPDTLDTAVYDEVVAVTGDEAYAAARDAGPYRRGVLARGVLRRGGPRGPHPGPAAGHAGQDHRGGAPRYWRALPLYRAVCVNRARWTQSAAWLRPQAFCLWPEPYYVWSWASRAARSGADSAGASFSAGPPGSGFESTGTPPPGRCPENRPPPGGSAG